MSKAYTPSEARESSSWLNPPETRWPTATECKGLEDETGADICLTGYAEPLRNMRQVSEQLQAGVGVLCQIKVGNDLPASVGERLNDSLLKMQTFLRSIGVPESRIQSMCVLIYTGYHLSRADTLWTGEQRQSNERPYIHAEKYEYTHTNALALETALTAWTYRGGVVWPCCPTAKDLPAYLDRREKNLQTIVAEPVKYLFTSKEQIEKDVKEVYGGLQLLVDPPPTVQFFARAMSGMGKELAQRAVKFYIEDQGLTVLDALVQMSSPAGNYFPGWGKGRAAKLAQALAITQTKTQTIDNKEEG